MQLLTLLRLVMRDNALRVHVFALKKKKKKNAPIRTWTNVIVASIELWIDGIP